MNKRQRRLLGLKKAKRVLRVYRATASPSLKRFYTDDGEQAKRLFHTRVRCSCPACGHRRETAGLTRQELLAEEEFQEQLAECLDK